MVLIVGPQLLAFVCPVQDVFLVIQQREGAVEPVGIDEQRETGAEQPGGPPQGVLLQDVVDGVERGCGLGNVPGLDIIEVQVIVVVGTPRPIALRLTDALAVLHDVASFLHLLLLLVEQRLELIVARRMGDQLNEHRVNPVLRRVVGIFRVGVEELAEGLFGLRVVLVAKHIDGAHRHVAHRFAYLVIALDGIGGHLLE